MSDAVFVTGASGFIGRRVVPRLCAAGHRAVCLSRSAGPRESEAAGQVAWVSGKLEDPSTYRDALAGCGAVVHLAALTGKARASAYEAANVDATRALIAAAKEAGVSRFVHVSTIAVRYPEKRAYPYARSKEAAEALVRESGLRWTILRPTIVLGPGSSIFESLRSLAGLPVTPMFGDGRTRVQPIHVDDVALAIADAVDDESCAGAEIDLGGPEELTFEELLRRIQVQVKGRESSVLHLPMVSTMACLRVAEPLFLPVMPVTAGQLYAFRYDSTAEDSAFLAARKGGLASVEAMLAASAEGESAASAAQAKTDA